MSKIAKDPRQAALEYFEKTARLCQQHNDDDAEFYRLAVNALRRSQDHTAIQNKLNGAMRYLRRFVDGQSIEMNQLKEFIGEPYVTASAKACGEKDKR